MENFWQSCSTQLEQELTPQQFSAWIKPLAPLDFEEGRLRIAAPNRFKLDWVKTQFASRISALAAQFWEVPIDVQFVLDPRTNVPRKPAVAAPQGPGDADYGHPNIPARGTEAPIEATPRRDQSRNRPSPPRIFDRS